MKVEIVPGGRNKNAQSPSPPPKEEQDLETGHVFDEMELLDSSEKSSTCSEDSLDDDYKPKGYRAVKPVGRIRKLKTEHNARKTSLHKKLQESKGSPRSDRPLIKHLLEGLSPGCAYNLSKVLFPLVILISGDTSKNKGSGQYFL